jgi:hypothetical protein
MTRKNLIIIYHAHAGRDFREIAEKIHALDASITIFCVPDPEWRHTTLTVAMGAIFKLPIKRGPILGNRQIAKLAQQDILRAHVHADDIPPAPLCPLPRGVPQLFSELLADGL